MATSNAIGPIAYVVKRYPRFSETFIVNEILQHEAMGSELEVFSLRPSVDTHFQNIISEVRAPINYLPHGSVKSGVFWRRCHEAARQFPNLWHVISEAHMASVDEVFQAIELALAINTKKIAHLHAHFATSATTVARLAALISGTPYSVTMHAKDIFHESVVRDDLRQKISDAKFVVTVSDFNKQFLSSQFGSAEKIHRIYNGMDLELFKFHSEPEPSRSIISVGRLVPKKGFKYLIDACQILAKQGVEFDCEIIGSGDLESELRAQIVQLGLCERVCLSGPMPQNVIRAKMQRAAIFAAPCVIGDDGNRDGLPTVITESMAIGTPCVSTDVTGIPEIVRHGETGVIVEQENAVDLAAELQRLLDSPARRQTLAANGRSLIEREFDGAKNVNHIRNLIIGHEVATARQKPHRMQFQGAQ